jgi:hypothetical protein
MVHDLRYWRYMLLEIDIMVQILKLVYVWLLEP